MQGVYTLANDAVIDWLIALLESLRSDPANATLPVTVIPYDHRVERTRALQADYRFEVLQDDALTVLDRLGAKVSRPDRALLPDLRKFAAFWGPYEQFVYLDADIVVVEDIRRLLETARAPGADLIYFDHDIRQVYREDRVADLPFDVRTAPGFNAGAFASRHGVFDLAAVEAMVDLAQPFRECFTACVDQPFLNFAFDASNRTAVPCTAYFPEVASAMWAGLQLEQRGAHWTVANVGRSDHGKRLPFIHWAGFTLTPWMPHKQLWLRYRLGPVRKPSRGARIRVESRLATAAARRAARAARRSLSR